MATNLSEMCESCGRRPVQYQWRSNVGWCRICWALSTGDTPEDLAERDATDEEQYKVLVVEYRKELWADPTLRAYYQSKQVGGSDGLSEP